jgi:hypothetical protein
MPAGELFLFRFRFRPVHPDLNGMGPSRKRWQRSLQSRGLVLHREFNQFRKRIRIVDGDFGKGFAVEFYERSLQSGDEQAVTDAAHAAGSADANNPKPPELPFLDASIAEREFPRSDERDAALLVEVVAAKPEAFGQFSGTGAFAQNRFPATCANHCLTPQEFD